MILFFFHVHNRIGFVEDEEGRELADLEAARHEAIAGARSIVSEEAKQGCVDLRGRIDVADAERNILLSIPFDEAIEVLTGQAPSLLKGEGLDQA